MDNSQATHFDKVNKYLTIALVILFLVSILCAVFSYLNLLSETIPVFFSSLGGLLGVFFLIRNGTFYRTRFWRLLYFCIALCIIAGLAKIQHWAWANEAFNLLWGLFIIIYSLHFFKKNNKDYFDYLKWIWVVLNFVGNALVYEILISRDWLFIPEVLLWVLVLIQIKLLSKKQFATS